MDERVKKRTGEREQQGKLEGRHQDAAQRLRRLLTFLFGTPPAWAEIKLNAVSWEPLEPRR